MNASATEDRTASGGATLYVVYLLALASALAGNLLVRLLERAGWVGEPGRIALGVLAVVPLMVAAAMFWKLRSRRCS